MEGNASKITAGSWLANSDRRIKTGIRDLEKPLEVIGRLHPVKFRYTEDYRARHPTIRDVDYTNFIAQEYREAFPESVQDDGTGLLQIDTHNVTPYLVAGTQELGRKVAAQEAEISRLRDRLAALERAAEAPAKAEGRRRAPARTDVAAGGER